MLRIRSRTAPGRVFDTLSKSDGSHDLRFAMSAVAHASRKAITRTTRSRLMSSGYARNATTNASIHSLAALASLGQGGG